MEHKKINYIITLFIIFFALCLVLSGCGTKQDSGENNTSKMASENSEPVENSGGTGEQGTNSEEITAENSETQETVSESPNIPVEETEPVNGDNIGTPVNDNGSPLPEEVVGTWTVVEGMPNGVNQFSLVINPDGSTLQNVETTDGSPSSVEMHTSVSDNGYSVADSKGNYLFSFTFENGQILAQGLSPEQTVFQKSE